MIKLCVYGGHYGSEGKGAAAEFHIRRMRAMDMKVAAFGENSPNSGHTCSAGKTKNIPASSFFADVVVLGPDAVIDIKVLAEDVAAVRAFNPTVEFYCHEHAAFMAPDDKSSETDAGLISRIGSTGSGSGKARTDKYFRRHDNCVIIYNSYVRSLLGLGVRIVNRSQFVHLVDKLLSKHAWVFECSQGALLDTNWGTYPFVTSRTTLPQAAIERNGLGGYPWQYAGVYRTYPIRTGGNSGPTGGAETTFAAIGVEQEIATVTKRIRRVFEFSAEDFALSLFLTRPNMVMFTHGDYLMSAGKLDASMEFTRMVTEFYFWLIDEGVETDSLRNRGLYVSFAAGSFHDVGDTHLLAEAAAIRETTMAS